MVDGLARLVAGCRRVAMQYSARCAVPYVSMVDAGTVELVRSLGPEVISSADLIQFFEARWDGAKVASHLEAGRRVDRIRREAFELVRHRLHTGQTVCEWEVRQFIRDQFAAAGLVTGHGPIVGASENSANPHYEPTQQASREILPGDVLLIDMWAKLDQPRSVYYDITWTGFCGSAPPTEVANVFEIVRVARDRAVNSVASAVRRGVVLRGFEVDDVARGFIKERGFGDRFVHRTGHSIGEEVHGAGANLDNMETHDERAIIADTCFSVEPGIYLEDFGVRLEVNVFVNEKEAKITGEAQNELVLL
jgi:Xaa-Pro aminopeptidase